MIHSRPFILTSLVFPIIALAGLAVQKAMVRDMGRQLTLNISGCDPRDLLSGHYLNYTIDYSTEDICRIQDRRKEIYYYCPDQQRFFAQLPSDCSYFIKGACRGRRFEAGIERFYIPEKYAATLDKLVQNKKGSIILSVPPNGEAQVKELLIEGQPWQEFLDSESDEDSKTQ